MASLDDFDDDNEQVTAELGNLGLTAAGFDYFNSFSRKRTICEFTGVPSECVSNDLKLIPLILI